MTAWLSPSAVSCSSSHPAHTNTVTEAGLQGVGSWNTQNGLFQSSGGHRSLSLCSLFILLNGTWEISMTKWCVCVCFKGNLKPVKWMNHNVTAVQEAAELPLYYMRNMWLNTNLETHTDQTRLVLIWLIVLCFFTMAGDVISALGGTCHTVVI